MPITTAPPRDHRIAVVLAVLFSGAFVMGCAEMLVVGMLDLIAADLAVPVSAAGALVTANALGLAIGGPLLTFLTIRLDRRTVLLGALLVFVLANLLPALAAGYPVFMAARVLIGAVQGLFIAAAFVTATSVVPPERIGRAMAVVVSGFAMSSAFGLPVGTLLGQAVGWRGSFGAVVVVGVVVLALALVVLPAVPTPRDSRGAGQARYAFAPRVLAVLALSSVIFVAIQSALTYLVPFLDRVTGVSGPQVSLFLLAYGAATAIGSFAGGRFADANAARSLVVGSTGVTASLLALLLLGGNGLLVFVAVFAVGLFGMGMAPSMQFRVTSLAGPGGPLASALPASAVNAGIAVGSLAGGAAIEVAGVRAAVLTGAVVAALAIAGAWLTRGLVPPAGTAGAVEDADFSPPAPAQPAEER
ncbi:MFS transporter [Blastococcus xanthinilyticus]|uniref:DHA1 family inner membrane transport protein n=1 Tax=Blastococcus xanthinilyticus TaxID=1564164 RepID=A0A5S5D771_9ACTN|nr:MFS transporter [Blastococcus xanthinilyticus]TYP90612.1 DHA1 family inner membrane transport protein [Blastococcus xanthinilyticus]